MATSSVLSKCKRKGLFQTNFPKGLSGSCTVRTVMKNFLYPVLCLSRQFAIKVSFPWTQNNTGKQVSGGDSGKISAEVPTLIIHASLSY